MQINGHGGSGGRIQIIDFVAFFVGLKQKSCRIVSYGLAADERRQPGYGNLDRLCLAGT